MIEREGHETARREDATWLEGGLVEGGYLPEGKRCLSYWGIWIAGSLTVSLLGVIGALLSELGY